MTKVVHSTDPLLLLHLVWHCYLEAEHEIYGSLPAISAKRAVDVTFERFAEAPFMKEFNAWSLEELLEKLKEWGFVKEVVITEEKDGVFRCEIKGCMFAEHFHPYIEKEYMCPFILLVAMKLEKERGLIRFVEHLPTLTEDGVIASVEVERGT